jgi:hypothetical protein
MTNPRSQEYEDMRRRWIERKYWSGLNYEGPSFQRDPFKVLSPQSSHNPTWKNPHKFKTKYNIY